MAIARIVKAIDKNGIEQELSIRGWAEHEGDISRSHYRALFSECMEEEMSEQEAVYSIRSQKNRRQGRSRVVSEASKERKPSKEEIAMDKCADVARRFLFPNGHLI